MNSFFKNNGVVSKMLRALLVAVSVCISSCVYAKQGDIVDASKLLLSAASFHLTLFSNKCWYRSGCTFDVICWAGDVTRVERDNNGVIVAIYDGRRTPLVLGSIPCNKKHIHSLRKELNLPNSVSIELFTLARAFECDWAGLSELIATSGGLLTQFSYPTTDFTTPTLGTLVRAIHDLRTRDERNGRIAYVHCKTGKGRSATVVAAYLIAVLHDSDVAVTPDEIERFLQSCRPQVKLSIAQKQQLIEFQTALQQAGNFEKLYAQSVQGERTQKT